MRVAGGLGTIPRVVGDGQEIYRERLAVDDALGRIEALYKPYHRALRRLINKARISAFGTAILVDCHSMPSVGVSREERRRPDIVIGDRYGTSCAGLLPDLVEEILSGLGYSIGPQQALCRRLHHRALRQSGERTARRAARDQPRRFIWTSGGRERGPRFAQVAADFTALADALAQVPLGDLGPFQAAAE